MHEIAVSSKYIRVFTFRSFYQRWDIFNFDPRHPRHLGIIEQSSNQFKKSAFNFQTAAMLDYWNSEQVNLLLSQEMQSGNSNIPIKVFKETTELHTQVEITNADQYKVSFQLIFQDHAKTVSWISEGIIDVPKN